MHTPTKHLIRNNQKTLLRKNARKKKQESYSCSQASWKMSSYLDVTFTRLCESGPNSDGHEKDISALPVWNILPLCVHIAQYFLGLCQHRILLYSHLHDKTSTSSNHVSFFDPPARRAVYKNKPLLTTPQARILIQDNQNSGAYSHAGVKSSWPCCNRWYPLQNVYISWTAFHLLHQTKALWGRTRIKTEIKVV